MKGIIFTEFLEMLEEKFSDSFVEDLIDTCDLPSGGAYSAVGTYDHQEVVTLVTALSEKTGVPAADLQKTYGQYLFGRFVALYPRFFENVTDAYDFLEAVEAHIHSEVQKLYPDARPPRVDGARVGNSQLTLDYRSDRPFADVAEGLIRGCLDHFQDGAEMVREDYPEQNGYHTKFVLTRQAA